MKKLALIMFVVLSIKAFPCYNDFDCGFNMECNSSGFGQSGVCVLKQGSFQQAPSQQVQTCTYDQQCGYGKRCIKRPYQYDGICY